MGQEVDQYRLCCGSLLEAELVNGRIVLRCLACGIVWQRCPDGALSPVPEKDVDAHRPGPQNQNDRLDPT